MPSLHLQTKLDSTRNLSCCAISRVIVWKAAIISLRTSSYTMTSVFDWSFNIAPEKVIQHIQIWRSCRPNDRTISTNPSVSKTSIENFPYSARIMCGSSIMLKNQRFPLSERNVLQKILQLILNELCVRSSIKVTRKKFDLKIAHWNVKETMQQKECLDLQKYLSLCWQILLPTHLSISNFQIRLVLEATVIFSDFQMFFLALMFVARISYWLYIVRVRL